MRASVVASLLFGLLVASGCNTPQRQEIATDTRLRGIDGAWASVGGAVAYNANFAGGRFTSTEGATGAILAEGSYKSLGPGQVSIEYTSRVRGTRIAANCNQVEPDRLACASSNGNRFEFTRRA